MFKCRNDLDFAQMNYYRETLRLKTQEIAQKILEIEKDKIQPQYLDVLVPENSKPLEILELHKNGLDEFLVELPLRAEDLVFPTQIIDLELGTGAPPIKKPDRQDLQGLEKLEMEQHNSDYKIYNIRDLKVIFPTVFSQNMLNLYVLHQNHLDCCTGTNGKVPSFHLNIYSLEPIRSFRIFKNEKT